MPKTDSDKKKEEKVESKPKPEPKPKVPSAYDKALAGMQEDIVKLRKRVTFLETEVNRIRNCRGL